MTNYIQIPEEMARKLHAIAKQEDAELAKSVGEMIESQLDDRPWATLADLHRFAAEARKRMKPKPDAEIMDDFARRREILSAEYADFLASCVDA